VRINLRLHLTVLAVAALAVLTLGTGVASAHGDDGKTLKLVAKELQFQYVDEAPPGPSLGDEIVFSEKLKKDGRHVGMSGVVCTITHATPPYDVLTFHCVGTLSLRHGQITLQGLIEVQGENDPGPFTVAITGGTGAYRGAGGEAVVREVAPGVSVYKLRFDSPKKHKSDKKHKPRRDRRH
jgi:hypothetical protein